MLNVTTNAPASSAKLFCTIYKKNCWLTKPAVLRTGSFGEVRLDTANNMVHRCGIQCIQTFFIEQYIKPPITLMALICSSGIALPQDTVGTATLLSRAENHASRVQREVPVEMLHHKVACVYAMIKRPISIDGAD